ncbi:ubiquinone biosynthesis regulatory protein kinase UbiB [Candidatus Williamhamiltonella defendens]|uniref:Probable protein kinase UbiB n=1 Tax=Candidatus Williamhamiltonella defendens TaxID=138072 RepID=A0A2D3T8N2_9ENTR|nr:ubiquinone biosynthesis regulatory protein kinase UbiB [Candidatus Hamiltonella defensa]ASV33014.1 ubiquinone biosynthesis regulatory protein kinase UbiB [Candidatus Hamiltonella defensa]ATW30161.1 ubiquinone biosynthesis regulatory protein kinase UbiB [Candidatus Hamiltonella defensa]ATW32172.1 ubiquinone biosynthesis regulatory protein kinase UbiB [Candidatus Hamiltonella defensa]AWK15966.1 ubiquinone biosynthesis regulatory protein kinase UbiB [Candidatus Hamiltonella defensa]MBK4361822.
MTLKDIGRLYFIIKVFLDYGLNELIPRTRFTLPIRGGCKLFFWILPLAKDKPLGERLRLALQRLGPVWIKFGQMISTRRDLFPADIIDELALLQDQVEPFDGLIARQQIESALGGTLETWFEHFDLNPLASASIAQVHTARLKKNGKEVVLKVIRPDIHAVIVADISLMYCLAGWLPKLLSFGYQLRPKELVKEYEKTLLNELNLLREAANAMQFRRHFENNEMLYIPEIYFDYCRENLLVMERIYGIPVSDIATLQNQGTHMARLAERGVQVFFTQVFRDSFFHADMHPGNIFVNAENPENPQYIAVDFGIVGSLNKQDKHYLAENFLAFFNRDYRRVAQLYIDSGWIPIDTDVEDFEFAIRTVCEPIFKKPLAEISFGHFLVNLFNTARRFNMKIQPQLVLLQKTLLYVEGLGRQLYPELNLWTTAKPFLEDWLKSQVGMRSVLSQFKEKIPSWTKKFPELPDLLYDSLQQHKRWQYNVEQFMSQFQKEKKRSRKSRYLFYIGAISVTAGVFLQWMDSGLLFLMFYISGVIVWLKGWKYLN